MAWCGAEVLSELGLDSTFEPLAKALEHPSNGVVSNAAEALGALSDDRAIELFVGLLQHKSRMVKSRAVGGLALAGATEQVLTILLTSEESRLRRKASKVYGSLGSEGVEALFARLEEVDGSTLSAYVVVALGGQSYTLATRCNTESGRRGGSRSGCSLDSPGVVRTTC
ncbi:MAG: HEAT repeat domain-containing protein [Proteobacteria bacterium]|nr:HEAT repeat domain-containing protein [Pseudomonadota bacterium]